MNPEALHFAAPLWLAVAAAVSVLGALGVLWERRRRKQAIHRLAQAHLLDRLETSASPARRLSKRLMLMGAVVLSLLALARPQYGYHWEEAKRQGIEIMFAVDTSKSMLAQDLRPDRLTRAKLAISDLIEKFEGDRVGLVAFAGDAFLQVPMTVDRGVFEQSLRAMKPGIVPVGGSDLASAIRVAQRAFEEAGSGQRILVLLSDGEDLEGSAIAAATDAADAGITIYTVGVGSTDGELLVISDGSGGTKVVRDEQGEPVRSRLDEATLTELATVTGGAYLPLTADGMGLERLYSGHLAQLTRHTVESRSHRVYHDRFAWLLLPALLLLLIEPFVGERGRLRPLGRALPAALALGLVLARAPSAIAATPQGVDDYNAGVDSYASGDWDAASTQFEAAIPAASADLQQQSWYNMGNSHYRAGEALLQTEPSKTRTRWEQAVSAYETAIELDPDDEDAVFNRDFVLARLDELEEPPADPNDEECDNPSDEGGGGNEGDAEDDSESGADESGADNPDGTQGDDGADSADGPEQDGAADAEDEAGEQSSTDGQPEDEAGEQSSTDGKAGTDAEGQTPDAAADADAGGSDEGQQEAESTPTPQGLAGAAPEADGSMSEQQAAALIQRIDGDDAAIPMFTPGVPADAPTTKDW